MGYGDVSINKNMKKYVNLFYDIYLKLTCWEKLYLMKKKEILNEIINNPKNISFYTNYFDKLCIFIKIRL